MQFGFAVSLLHGLGSQYLYIAIAQELTAAVRASVTTDWTAKTPKEFESLPRRDEQRRRNRCPSAQFVELRPDRVWDEQCQLQTPIGSQVQGPSLTPSGTGTYRSGAG